MGTREDDEKSILVAIGYLIEKTARDRLAVASIQITLDCFCLPPKGGSIVQEIKVLLRENLDLHLPSVIDMFCHAGISPSLAKEFLDLVQEVVRASPPCTRKSKEERGKAIKWLQIRSNAK